MSAIRQLQERIRVAEPFTRRNLTVFPIVDEQSPVTADYLPFGYAQKTGMIRVTEVSEGGSVPQLAVETLGGKAVILLDGEELIGARQNRIVNLTILAADKTIVVIPVSCVERGRWAYRSRDFTESPRTMYPRARAQKMMDVTSPAQRSCATNLWCISALSGSPSRGATMAEAVTDAFARRSDVVDITPAAAEV